MLSEAHPDHITERLLKRARLLSNASDAERDYWRQVFDLSQTLGKLLHVARECLDSALVSCPVDATTMRLWEQGLMSPDEITNGDVTATVRWYIDAIRRQRENALPHQLSTDAFSLFNELTNEVAQEKHDWQK